MHVHVISGDGESKFWIEPEIELAINHGHTARQAKEIERMVVENKYAIISAWKSHFGG